MRLKVHGPYKHYSKWRIFVTRLGVKTFKDFPTEDEALTFKPAFSGRCESRTARWSLKRWRSTDSTRPAAA